MRDTHGRASHADNDPRRRPPDGFRLRDARRFRQLAAEIPSVLPARLLQAAPSFAVTVEDVPPPDDGVPTALALARYEPGPLDASGEPGPPGGSGEPGAPGGSGGRLVLYRRAVEARAASRFELGEVLRSAAIDAITEALGISDPEDPWDEDQD